MKGAIAWMARHPVASNLLMIFLLAAGMLSTVSIVQEVFPEFALDIVQVRVSYPGATPEEVEDGIIQRIEERIESVDGLRRVTSVASEGVGVVLAEMSLGTDIAKATDDVKAEIDRITSFPEEAEEPEVTRLVNRSRVIDIAVFGDVPERTLKEIANRIEDDLATLPEISFVQTAGVRAYEVSIEVPNENLRAWGLSLDEIARTVRASSLDLPGGRVDTRDEEILVRTKGQNYRRDDFAEIIVRGTRDGSTVRLDRIATIRDGFEDADLITRYDGKPAALVQVFRTSDEQVLRIVEEVERYLDEELAPTLPAGVGVEIWQNDAELLDSRLSLLRKNGILGLALVLLALALFLDLRLAFWVAIGIALSFIGTFAVMPWLGISVNMMSLFGFILAIGIVVDDAIVVGENIYKERELGAGPMDAAVAGVQRVAVPVVFAVMTTVVAFTPLLFTPGVIGKFLKFIPMVVIAVLLFSLVESLLILPHHLSKLPEHAHMPLPRWLRWIERVQEAVQGGLQRFIDGPLDRTVGYATRSPGFVIAAAVSLMLVTAGIVAGRYISFSFLPRIEGDEVIARLEMPEGTPSERTLQVAEMMEREGRRAAAGLAAGADDDEPPLVDAVLLSVGRQPSTEVGPAAAANIQLIKSNIAELTLKLSDAEIRSIPAKAVEDAWREAVGEVTGARTLAFSSQVINLGAPVAVEMSHPDTARLNAAVAALQDELTRFAGVYDVRNDQEEGKREVEFRLLPRARTLGVTLDDLARQVRAAFFGSEALRVQRGREEVRIYVRLPERERSSLADIRAYRIITPTGAAIPVSELAEAEFGTAPSTIRRLDGRRIVTVTAEVDRSRVTGQEVNDELTARVLPALQERFPGMRWTFGGEQREQAEALAGLARGFLLALLAMYALLALPFRSYVEPLIIMAAVPFGFIGAILGHLVLGLDLGMLSMFGLVGLSGVIVNDSLVFIDFINERKAAGLPLPEAVREAARVRFRPILLTSLTTFLGVFPLIIERSVQAQFLVPMAVSLGVGILFGTAVIMVLVPALTVAQDRACRRFEEWRAQRIARARGLEPSAVRPAGRCG
ncbi:MAG: efflux RND transporter permease subunit [Gemmatimonadota bacterium]|nr:efflux RND transporter permease subunit [Gemmatimonadota bacterium]